MLVYLDSSVLLRVIFQEGNRLKQFDSIKLAVTSQITRVECLRTIDRIRLQSGFSDEFVVEYSEATHEILSGTHTVLLAAGILDRAAQPFPTSLGTLDAIHMTSALAWQITHPDQPLIFTTHDIELGRAARALGFRVLGC